MVQLSTGDYWRSIAHKTRLENLEYRERLNKMAIESRAFQAEVREACRRDLLFYINSFVWQYNPKKKGGDAVGPFILWPFQVRALMDRPPRAKGILWCYEHDRTAVIEKSREMGASWLFLIFQDWLCLFHEGVQALNISRNAKAVDSASRNSLFSKIRFMHKYLPDWLKGGLTQEKFFFEYDRTGSEITGEASTGSAGAGGRGSVVFVDEFSQIQEDVKVRQNTASISDCRFFNGTHQGVGTEFFKLTQSDEIVKIQMHWTRHPAKNQGLYSWDEEGNRARHWEYDEKTDQINLLAGPKHQFPDDFEFDKSGRPKGGPHPGLRSPWYDWKAKDIGTARAVAMELDCDATGSSAQLFDPVMIDRLVNEGTNPVWQGRLEFDPMTHFPAELIEDEKGPLKLWLEPMYDSRGKLVLVTPGSYCGGGDVSQGTGATPSCASFGDARTGKKVAEYANSRVRPDQFAEECVAMCRLFADSQGSGAAFAWESAGAVGTAFGTKFMSLGYRNIYYRDQEVKFGARSRAAGETPGWYPQGTAKKELLMQYNRALERRTFKNPSKESLRECLLFVFKSDGNVDHAMMNAEDPTAARENHADRAIADALCNLMIEEADILTKGAAKVDDQTWPYMSMGWRMQRRAKQRIEAESAWY